VRALTQKPVVVDHHLPGDEPPGPVMVSDTTACATGELVFDIAQTLGLTITPDVATAIYTAMLTDTGGFRFSNTSPRCHAIAGELLRAGVNPEEMYRRIYASVPMGRLTLLAESLQTLGAEPAIGLAWIEIPEGAVERHGVKTEDLDGIAEYPRSLAGTRLALLFRDLGHDRVKISFRSVGTVDVNALARQFGGGGHARASGALVEGPLADVRARVLTAAREALAAT
jgi:phosphoesterase RecJ-like protein